MDNEKRYLTREEFYMFLEEDRKKWDEWREKWREHLGEWREHHRQFEQHLSEDQKRWDENQKVINRMLDRITRFEQYTSEDKKRWDENQKNINGMLAHLSKHGDFIGFGIEGMAAILLPPYLEDKYKLRIKELRKEIISVNGKELEINLFGRARLGKKSIAILVECKSTIGKTNLKAFLRKIRVVEPFLKSQGMNVIKIVFGPFIHHSAAQIAREEGIEMVSSVPQKV